MSDAQLDRRNVLIGTAAWAAATAIASCADAAPTTKAALPFAPVLQGSHKVEPLSFDPALSQAYGSSARWEEHGAFVA